MIRPIPPYLCTRALLYLVIYLAGIIKEKDAHCMCPKRLSRSVLCACVYVCLVVVAFANDL